MKGSCRETAYADGAWSVLQTQNHLSTMALRQAKRAVAKSNSTSASDDRHPCTKRPLPLLPTSGRRRRYQQEARAAPIERCKVASVLFQRPLTSVRSSHTGGTAHLPPSTGVGAGPCFGGVLDATPSSLELKPTLEMVERARALVAYDEHAENWGGARRIAAGCFYVGVAGAFGVIQALLAPPLLLPSGWLSASGGTGVTHPPQGALGPAERTPCATGG